VLRQVAKFGPELGERIEETAEPPEAQHPSLLRARFSSPAAWECKVGAFPTTALAQSAFPQDIVPQGST
jgi:hypothetical protein